ncbi:hypothetical protein ABK905_18935 [Acerihabitans sp. KWT182]|uniref:Uncharacterized protein n=1 Tax=Acerihabitans sp. KWT182 TaxID=3157919 RepID=A0AAU7Q6R0_9GAMM
MSLGIVGNTWKSLSNSFASTGNYPIFMSGNFNVRITNNVIYINQDVELSAYYSFINVPNTSCKFTRIENNALLNNVQTYGIRLMSAKFEIADIRNNYSDTTTTPMSYWNSGMKGPITLKNNCWVQSNPATDYNKVANLSTYYKPHRGDIVDYLIPSAGAIVGMVYDGANWYSAGTVGSTIITS